MVERRTHDRKVSGSVPGRRIFFSRVNFLSWLKQQSKVVCLLAWWRVKVFLLCESKDVFAWWRIIILLGKDVLLLHQCRTMTCNCTLVDRTGRMRTWCGDPNITTAREFWWYRQTWSGYRTSSSLTCRSFCHWDVSGRGDRSCCLSRK